MKVLNKLFIFLCIVIMFFGIAGCPNSNDDPPPQTVTSSIVKSPQVGDNTSGGDDVSPVPEPATLVLLGSGLIGIAGIRRKFKK